MRREASASIAARVLDLPELAGASAVMVYGAAAEEADPGPIERQLRDLGVRIAYPRVAGPAELAAHWVDTDTTLVTGAFGLREPRAEAPVAPLEELDAIVVPGVAFDEEGYRLGFGGGYYDRLLARLPERTWAIGIAYDLQIVERLPRGGHDHPVDVVVTPTRVIRPAAGR